MDILFWGVTAGSIYSFVTVYLARLGASPLQISLVTAGPALVNLFLALPAGRWIRGRSYSRVVFYCAIAYRLPYFGLILFPTLLLNRPEMQIWVLVSLFIAISPFMLVLTIALTSLIAEVAPAEWRGELVGRRTALLALSWTVTSLVCGQILDLWPYPANFQVVFGIGVLGSLLSLFHLGRLRLDPNRPPAVRQPGSTVAAVMSAAVSGKSLLRLDILSNRSFGFFLAGVLTLQTVRNIPIPLYSILWVNELDLSNSSISLALGLTQIALVFSALNLGHAGRRWGFRRLLAGGSTLLAVQPFLNGLASSRWLVWAGAVFGGTANAWIDGALVNRLMEQTPQEDSVAYNALYFFVTNGGVLVGALLGPALVGGLGLRPVLLLVALLLLVNRFVFQK